MIKYLLVILVYIYQGWCNCAPNPTYCHMDSGNGTSASCSGDSKNCTICEDGYFKQEDEEFAMCKATVIIDILFRILIMEF